MAAAAAYAPDPDDDDDGDKTNSPRDASHAADDSHGAATQEEEDDLDYLWRTTYPYSESPPNEMLPDRFTAAAAATSADYHPLAADAAAGPSSAAPPSSTMDRRTRGQPRTLQRKHTQRDQQLPNQALAQRYNTSAAAAAVTAAADVLDEGTRAFVESRAQQAPDLTLQVEENILTSQAKQIRQFARRHHSTQPSAAMPPGSFVMMQSPATSKMHKGVSIEGPYRLVRYTGPDQTKAIIEDANKKCWPVHCTRITPYSVKQNKTGV
jgi:hypothetical protein